METTEPAVVKQEEEEEEEFEVVKDLSAAQESDLL